jgi:hypothetical protein
MPSAPSSDPATVVRLWSKTEIRFKYPFPAEGSVVVRTAAGQATAGTFVPTWSPGQPLSGAFSKAGLLDVTSPALGKLVRVRSRLGADAPGRRWNIGHRCRFRSRAERHQPYAPRFERDERSGRVLCRRKPAQHPPLDAVPRDERRSGHRRCTDGRRSLLRRWRGRDG